MSLTEDRMTTHRDGGLVPFAVAAGEEVFGGALVAVNAAGFLVAGKAEAGLTYLGRADAHINNSAGIDGAKTIQVRRNVAFLWRNSNTNPIGQNLVGKICYIQDDETVAGTDGAGSRSKAGVVLALEPAGVWVE